jgi:hypothetical protein
MLVRCLAASLDHGDSSHPWRLGVGPCVRTTAGLHRRLGPTADRLARLIVRFPELVELEPAVVAALAPICVDQYQRSPGAAAQQAVLDEEGPGALRRQVELGGWARMPGSTTARPGVAQACPDLIMTLN